MATKLNDIRTAGFRLSYPPTTGTDTSIATEPIDFINDDGPAHAIIAIDSEEGHPELSGVVEASADGETWSTVATIEPETDVPLRLVMFHRTGRYVRANLTIDSDSDPYTLCVLLGQSRKLL